MSRESSLVWFEMTVSWKQLHICKTFQKPFEFSRRTLSMNSLVWKPDATNCDWLQENVEKSNCKWTDNDNVWFLLEIYCLSLLYLRVIWRFSCLLSKFIVSAPHRHCLFFFYLHAFALWSWSASQCAIFSFNGFIQLLFFSSWNFTLTTAHCRKTIQLKDLWMASVLMFIYATLRC